MHVMEIIDHRLRVAERPVPEIGHSQVLIKVEAAGVNRADIFQVAGNYPPPPGCSDIPGLEVAGTIVALGKQVTGWKEGDRVAALLPAGGYAQYAVADAALLLPIPSGLSAIQAAALPEAVFTVWMNLYEKGKLQAGDDIVIHAGASGIGTMAIQCARLSGAKVWITAGSEEKCDACIAFGAHRAINYHKQDFVEVIKQETGGKGVRLVLDVVGGDYIERNMRAASFGGVIINLAFLQSAKATVNFAPLLMKNLTIMGTTLRAQPLEVKAQLAEAIKTNLWPHFEEGRLKPLISKVFSLQQAEEAHAFMASNRNIGKIVLAVA